MVNLLKAKKFLVLSLFFLMSLMLSACGDDPETIVKTFIDNSFAHAENNDPTPEERYQAIMDIVSPKLTQHERDYSNLPKFVKMINQVQNRGINKPYFIAEDPTQPQGDSQRVYLVQIPKSSLMNSYLFLGADFYFRVTLRDIDGDWKIEELDEVSPKEVLSNNSDNSTIDWQEVEPF